MFTENGVEVYTPDESVIEAYSDYVHENVWPKIASEYGDIWDDIVAEVQG